MTEASEWKDVNKELILLIFFHLLLAQVEEEKKN